MIKLTYQCIEAVVCKIHDFSLLLDRLHSKLGNLSCLQHIMHSGTTNHFMAMQWPQLMDRNRFKADSFERLQSIHLKPLIEALIIATQDQALHSHWLGYHILWSTNGDLCRRYCQFLENIKHKLLSLTALWLAQSVCLERHYIVPSAVHWNLCHMCSFTCGTSPARSSVRQL